MFQGSENTLILYYLYFNTKLKLETCKEYITTYRKHIFMSPSKQMPKTARKLI